MLVSIPELPGKLNALNIQTNNQEFYKAHALRSEWFLIFDSAAGSGWAKRRFVLLSPDLSDEVLDAVQKLLRKKQIASGFQPLDAWFHGQVYVVGSFPDAEIEQLRQRQGHGLKLHRVPGRKLETILNKLTDLLKQA